LGKDKDVLLWLKTSKELYEIYGCRLRANTEYEIPIDEGMEPWRTNTVFSLRRFGISDLHIEDIITGVPHLNVYLLSCMLPSLSPFKNDQDSLPTWHPKYPCRILA
jgi:hypothetical protein